MITVARKPTINYRRHHEDVWHVSVACQVVFALTLVQACWPTQTRGDDVVFADDFDSGLSSEWNVAGVRGNDYRIRDGGLELLVQPGVFSPAQPEFIGQPGEEGDPEKYTLRFWPATKESGPLRVIVRNNVAYAQTGPDSDGKYQNLYHSALVKDTKQRGFALVATGGPVVMPHWVRFDNFRIVRSR